MRKIAGYIWTYYNTKTEVTSELNITSVSNKLQEYRRNWLQHINRMRCNRLLRILKNDRPKGRRNQGRLLDV